VGERERSKSVERGGAWTSVLFSLTALLAVLGAGCLLAPSEVVTPSYFTSTDESLTDSRTQLTWQRNLPVADYTWEEAKAYCDGLELADTSWRLPSKGELETLVDDTRTAPPSAHPELSRTLPAFYWTATAVSGSDRMWQVNFIDGSSVAQGPPEAYVRCIESRNSLPGSDAPGRYAIGDDKVVLDKAINRNWQIRDGGSLRHDAALQYCSELDLLGTGWRLPARWELLTIVDSSRSDPAIDNKLFTDVPSEEFWTDTPYQPNLERFWTVDFKLGTSQGAASADASFRVRCVR
jgi:hypothetical protein